MNPKRIITLVVVVLMLAITGAYTMLSYGIGPYPPSQADLDKLESGFPAARGKLEEIVAFEQKEKGYLLKDAEHAAYQVRQAPLLAGARPPLKRVDAMSDSLIYIWGWERRGIGFDAGWAFAGYAYSTRPMAQGGKSSRKHLDGPWYLVSTVPGY